MTHRTDYFFIHIKSIYPNFQRPSELDEEIWDEILTPYNADEMKNAIKSYRKSEDGAFAPIPSKFAPYLRKIKKRQISAFKGYFRLKTRGEKLKKYIYT